MNRADHLKAFNLAATRAARYYWMADQLRAQGSLEHACLKQHQAMMYYRQADAARNMINSMGDANYIHGLAVRWNEIFDIPEANDWDSIFALIPSRVPAINR